MKTEQFTIAEISCLLENEQLSDDMIDQLQADKRKTVAQLLNKYRKRQAAVVAERQRLQKLYAYEQEFYDQGYELIAGVDEAGRGPLAGPVVVGAVILPKHCELSSLNDSKQLSSASREKLYTVIHETALAISYEVIDQETIDTMNIYYATIEGMYRCLKSLPIKPDAALIDAVPLPDLAVPSRSIIDGDRLSASIAAASIIAKVERDRIMVQYDALYPQYGFMRHKGYGTQEHCNALKQWGPCPIHRKTFEPVKSLIVSERFSR